MVEEELVEQAVDIRKRIIKEFPFIHASRVPVSTYEAFNELAEREFCGDFGMCIKWLLDQYLGLINKGNEHLENAVLDLNERLKKLESNFEKKEPKKRLDGRGGTEDGNKV